MTKKQILDSIKEAHKENKSISWDMKDLMHPFGFERLDGLTVMHKMARTGQTEEQVQTSLPIIVRDNIENWCNENMIAYHYDILKDAYVFKIVM